MIRVIATSDNHGVLPEIEPCDLLILGGDLCPEGSPEFQANWVNTTLRAWLEKVPAKEIVGVAGNHDYAFEDPSIQIPGDLRWHYLVDQEIELFGFRIYGMPWQPTFVGAFNLDEEDLAKKYAKIPSGVDIIVSHGPPYGYGDALQIYKDGKPDPKEPLRAVGSPALLKRIYQLKPKLVVFGHIHRAYGVYLVDHMVLANVSLLSDHYGPAYSPMIFYL